MIRACGWPHALFCIFGKWNTIYWWMHWNFSQNLVGYIRRSISKNRQLKEIKIDEFKIYCKKESIDIVNETVLDKKKKKMEELIKLDMPIEKLLINRKEALKYYQKAKEFDKVELLKYNNNTNINLYKLDN